MRGKNSKKADQSG